MQIEITGTPKFHFAIHKEDLAILMALSQRHYDGHCRSYSMTAAQTGKNGLLVIWGMYFEHPLKGEDPDVLPVSADWRDLDTLLKCMEMYRGVLSEDQMPRYEVLNKAFWQALTEARAQQQLWVHKFDSEPASVEAA